MRGKVVGTLLGALVLTMVAPAGVAAPVPDCPAIDAVEGKTLQCAVTPGLMTSTLEVPAGTALSVIVTGTMDGTLRISNELGRTIYLYEISTTEIHSVGFFLWGVDQVWTSTIELTSGFGAVVVKWGV